MRSCRRCGHAFTYSEIGWKALSVDGTVTCSTCGASYARVDPPRLQIALLGGGPWLLSGFILGVSGARFSPLALAGYAFSMYVLILLSAHRWMRWAPKGDAEHRVVQARG